MSATSGTYGVCHFWRLPRELRDEIYEVVVDQGYDLSRFIVRDSDLYRISAWMLWMLVVQAQAQYYQEGTFVHCFGVSRQYLAEIMPVFVHKTHLSFTPSDKLEGESFPSISSPVIRANVTSIGFQHCVCSGAEHIAVLINACPRLKAVCVSIDAHSLEEHCSARDWGTLHDASYFRERLSCTLEGLKRIRGLNKITLDSGFAEYEEWWSEQHECQLNAYEEELRQVVTQPRDA